MSEANGDHAPPAKGKVHKAAEAAVGAAKTVGAAAATVATHGFNWLMVALPVAACAIAGAIIVVAMQTQTPHLLPAVMKPAATKAAPAVMPTPVRVVPAPATNDNAKVIEALNKLDNRMVGMSLLIATRQQVAQATPAQPAPALEPPPAITKQEPRAAPSKVKKPAQPSGVIEGFWRMIKSK